METSVRNLFERYERFFKQSLGGDIDIDEVASLYTSDFIAASPAGVMTGKNDDQLKQVMARGYAHYRAMGTKGMRIRNVALSPIDEHHCVAHVAWTATYARQRQADVAVDFDVHVMAASEAAVRRARHRSSPRSRRGTSGPIPLGYHSDQSAIFSISRG
jgi:hypothetical protein